MKKLALCIVAIAVWSAILLFGQNPQNINGTWQGALKTPNAPLRIVIKISIENDKYKADLYSIDQRSPAIKPARRGAPLHSRGGSATLP